MNTLAETDELAIESEQIKGFSRTLAEIEWLLIALVIFYMQISGVTFEDKPEIILILVLFAVFVLSFHYYGFHKIHRKWKIAIETWAMIAFITLILWYLGEIESSLFSLYYLVIIAAAITLGKTTTLLEVGLISVCCLFLYFSLSPVDSPSLTQVSRSLIQLFPFWLVAYLAVMLSRDSEDAKKKIRLLSQTDDLTGLLNMRTFLSLAEKESTRAIRYNHTYSILMLDADDLKSINDTHGHQTGSNMIKLIGRILQKSLRSTDSIARYGGDEFVVLLLETDSAQAFKASERIRTAIETTPIEVSGEKQFITISIGIAGFPEHGKELQEIITGADKSLYTSKEKGRNRASIFQMVV